MASLWNKIFGGENERKTSGEQAAYEEAIRRTSAMVHDRNAKALAGRHGLDIVNVMWEDTARTKGSCWGPNISDMTIQVEHGGRHAQGTCLPVIRYPNFRDHTADLRMDDLALYTGNERGASRRRVSLRDYLGDLRRYLTEPWSWAGHGTSLLAPDDTHVLVSAQACLLPVPPGGEVSFHPALFNYQSREGSPAVLSVVASREGTSAAVLDNARHRSAAGWGQKLFFNASGERCPFTGTRVSDFVAGGGDETDAVTSVEEASARGLNMVLVIQVPLVQIAPEPPIFFGLSSFAAPCAAVPCRAAPKMELEEAVIGHGEEEGPFTEIANYAIERDARFPVRVTVQFYKATSDGRLTEGDVASIAAQIERVYADADYVGSLVTGGQTRRPTEPRYAPRPEPSRRTGSKGWWRV